MQEAGRSSRCDEGFPQESKYSSEAPEGGLGLKWIRLGLSVTKHVISTTWEATAMGPRARLDFAGLSLCVGNLYWYRKPQNLVVNRRPTCNRKAASRTSSPPV